MQFERTMIQFSLNKPGLLTGLMVLMTILLGTLIFRVHVDTDPENMLSEDKFVRIFHNQTKKEFNLHDVVVLGVVNEKNEHGVFNPKSLAKIHELSRFAATLADPNAPERKVIARDIIAPDNVDTIEQAGLGQVKFQWLMKEPPTSREEALKVRDQALANPLLKGTMVSKDGLALAIYLPITQKDFAHQVSKKLKEKIDELGTGDDKFYITGLPVAEDTFGKEMFIQMVFMVHKHIDKDDDRWLYLPALDLVKRIAASDKRTSFVGSNYLYEDVSGRGIDKDTHELIETTDEFYILKNIPINADEVEFSSYTLWIDKTTFLPMKAVYLNKNGKEYRIVETLEVQNFVGMPTVTSSRVTDLDAGSSTLSEFIHPLQYRS